MRVTIRRVPCQVRQANSQPTLKSHKLDGARSEQRQFLESKSFNPGQVWKQGDWMCPVCNNHNFGDKSHCNRHHDLTQTVSGGVLLLSLPGLRYPVIPVEVLL